MTGSDVLTTIAQIAATLAGFIALIGLFRPNVRRPMQRDEIAGQRLILETSFLAMFVALLPMLFYHTLQSETHVWRLSTLSGLTLFGLWYLDLRRRVQRENLNFTSTTGGGNMRQFVFVIATLLLIVLLVSNIVLMDSAAVYLWGLLLLLYIPVGQFLAFVYAYLMRLYRLKMLR